MKDLNDTDTSDQPEQNEFENLEIPGFNFINDPITTEEIRLNYQICQTVKLVD